MRDFLLANGELLVWVCAAVELLCVWLSLRGRRCMLGSLCAAISAGLVIDAAIIGLGVVLGEGTLLAGMSQVRYILHGILVPLMVPIAFYAYGMRRRLAIRILWVVTLLLMAGGVAMGVMSRIEPARLAGVLRYAQSAETPAFAKMFDRLLSIGGVIPLLVVGIAHLIRHRTPWLLLSGVFMFGAAALAPATHNMDLTFLITMFGEALMVLCFVPEVRRAQLNWSAAA